MLKLIRDFLSKTNNISRSTYIWNAVNATSSAMQSAVILIVMTRTNSVYDVGVFSIAYAMASLMLYIGQYGIRRYQASDVREKYIFEEYLGMRVITCIAMLVASLAYCVYGTVFKDYSADKFAVIFLICFLRCIQAFADVFHGRMQQKGRLDVATKASFARIAISTIVYMVALIVTHNLLISTIIWVAVALVIFLITTLNVARDYCTFRTSYEWIKMKGLFIEGFPIFAGLFLSMYIGNAPKYAIDAYLTEDVQAYYNLVFMPAFAVGLLANFIFNPIITSYAKVWADRNVSKFRKLVMRQILVVAGITVAGLIVAMTFGIPVLSLVFGMNLRPYKLALIIVMIGGGSLAYVTFFTTIVTIIRHQGSLLIGYGTVSLAALLLSKYFVVNYGINGAATMYAVLMTALAVLFGIITFVYIARDSSRWESEEKEITIEKTEKGISE